MGVLVEGFDSLPVMFMPYHPPYVGRHLNALGLEKAKDVVAYDLRIPQETPPALRHFASRLGQADRLRIRRVDMKRYGDELNTLIDIFNDAWSENWQFIPFTQAEAAHLSKGLRPLIDADLFWVAELDSQPVCMALCLPNLCEAIAGLDGRLLPFGWAKMLWRLKVAGVKTARVPLMGMRRRYHGTAIGAAILHSVFEALRGGLSRRGIGRVELSWVLEDNRALRRVLESLGAQVYKTYRLYQKEIP
jgi:GNAT superfamily N-acetyltransferase